MRSESKSAIASSIASLVPEPIEKCAVALASPTSTTRSMTQVALRMLGKLRHSERLAMSLCPSSSSAKMRSSARSKCGSSILSKPQRSQVSALVSMIQVLALRLPRRRVDAVRGHDEIAVGKVLHARFGLETHLHAQFAAAILQEPEQRDARAAAEPVAAAAQDTALVDDVDVAPIGEAAPDRFVRRAVGIAERLERFV